MANTAEPKSSAVETTTPQQDSSQAVEQLNLTQDEHGPTPKPDTGLPQEKSEESAPPSKPPRPLSPRAQAEKTLTEAFPTIDVSVVKAVLAASGGNVEPAFDALLGMTDPDSQKDAPPLATPQRPAQQGDIATSTAQSQLKEDETLARQLHEHYSAAGVQQRENQHRAQSRRPGEEDKEYSFMDDDLPLIRENIRKGFLETQTTVNKWVTNFKKKLDGEDDDFSNKQPARPAQNFQSGGHGYPGSGRRSGEMVRRSAERERYDADPQVLGDDFSTLELRDTEGTPPTKPQRPLADPNLFKQNSTPAGSRTVSSQHGSSEEANLFNSSSPVPSKLQTSNTKPSKWQPLSTVDPSPVAENDPFSLGDSDDDKETKTQDSKPPSPEDQQHENKAVSRDEHTKQPAVDTELEKKS